MKIYGIYEDNKYEQCRFVGTAKEITQEFNCHKTAISRAISRGSKFQKKYIILELYEEEVWKK